MHGDRYIVIYGGHLVGQGDTLADAASDAVSVQSGQGHVSPSWQQLVDCAVYERRGVLKYEFSSSEN